MTEQDKERVEEELRMHMAYDWFLDDNPDVQERAKKASFEDNYKDNYKDKFRACRDLFSKSSKNDFRL